MPIQKLSWRETSEESSLPLFLSTIVHTSIILLLAICISVEPQPIRSVLSASFGSDPSDSSELSTTVFKNSKLAHSDESEPKGIQVEMIALAQNALSASKLTVDLKSILPSVESPKEIRVQTGSNREPTNRQRRVSQVSTSSHIASTNQKTLSFGRKNAPGARQILPGPGATLVVIVPGLDPLGTSVLSQASNLSLTGGAMMVSTAKPTPALVNVPLRFRYDSSKEDGRRCVVNAGDHNATLAIYDWELQPLSRFVDSSHNGAVSIHILGNHEKVALDAAFEQTLLGLRFIQADMLPRGIIMSQEFLPQDDQGIIIGPGEQQRLSTDEDVESAVRELKPLMARTRNGASFSVLTDASIRFVFAIDGTELVIAGTPYFFFWEPANQGDQVIPKKALNEAIKKAWPTIKQANPLVIESMERCFRTVAFFRFQKQSSPENWSSFVEQVSKVKLAPVATPAILTN